MHSDSTMLNRATIVIPIYGSISTTFSQAMKVTLLSKPQPRKIISVSVMILVASCTTEDVSRFSADFNRDSNTTS
ncbi:hypothetical protein TELCIR_00227 [Teladorsagia circumcincta]|uniref:Uncharacterized protein n=1 Tax=Teladorsagia circumcincta TaxID=45464 RepID=A0A2G9V5H1_TELCI|nr:hypothetical protein TELCIR_00227 [Teladorsagia circumcincta]